MNALQLITTAGLLFAQASFGFEIHEWGTFTTVSGSDGKLLTGLQREEESLPAFVHSHYGFENGNPVDKSKIMEILSTHGYVPFAPGNKGFGSRPLSGVTVKMETPVIYFYSDESFRAHVEVGFNGGTISQWYPSRSGGETPPEPKPLPPNQVANGKINVLRDWSLDFSKGWNGSIQWDVDVLSREASAKTVLFQPEDTLNWERARVPDANVVRTDVGEIENYLFYRGIGNFDPGLKLTVTADESLHLENQSGGKIPFLLIFEKLADGSTRWKAFDQGMDSSQRLSCPVDEIAIDDNAFPQAIYNSMRDGLAGCGLTDHEANAMVQTWWNSYFATPGLRVFWVLPDAATHRILPLKVSPKPESITRVLVGRSEVLRPGREKQWLQLAKSEDSAAKNQWFQFVQNDRFGLAIEARISDLQKSLNEKATAAAAHKPAVEAP
ncbi:hypothetical protein JIN85_12570 [Luteolibacter pohnpeiensis]|uniref:Uncharacterized protein n=1 Tax=Luteolibacter pohnpeiensis TaxID=454153 RepID=A0A934VV65_9BACT|nr:hypothetical protein [Luteolibacter pohnpeiensis]MBK1883252.1 hypothetical protein [Luteolibacter pohnpeiensis]